ncbi:P-loop containing nucleoside triphosphate hydrolase protein [Cylindrobasidium torrendii FP15055 ss-10]|uniref:p-loop containing nucleoside triphosphate hydrolase protein n=1 Tax=Cylindrobasidium torrendii FP15055 ss-10 TaxID=1314674 RepID=A0A0D7AUZ9_9AGAR|nr:P-loop containing nucleoside triphosphate hydrolase protein [Cylindrobasidium torrendii FP15055 ss-10]
MDALKTFLSPLGMNTGAIQDTLKLVVIGGTVETARRASASAWNGFVDSFFLTAHFAQEDYPYDWIMHWLSKQPSWGRSREFDITTRTAGRMQAQQSGDVEEEDEEEDDQLVHGRRKRKVAFMPSVDTTHTIYYRGHWLRITRCKRYPDYGHGSSLKISVVARNNDILKKLVLEAKRDYEKDAEHRVHIFLADTTYPCWRWNGARQKRPMSSIVLQPGVKEMLLADCKDFLQSEEWYADRGIPFRRGYLLHGVPGSGKTSLIHSLAGELGLDIYVVSLSGKGMSDNTLTTLMGHVPSRCILLLEDLDAAFTRGISRDASSNGTPTTTSAAAATVPTSTEKKAEESDGSTLSLSGLLNALDGVAAAEGRLLFATTNHIERLDPALSRPGRMDVWVNFGHATKYQAEGIFKCFFPWKKEVVKREDGTAVIMHADGTEQEVSEEEKGEVEAANSKVEEKNGGDMATKNVPGGPSKRRFAHQIPVLSETEITKLAKQFGDAIPEDELSVAALQGYLLKNKTRPREAVSEVAAWIVSERETRAKLKAEKEKKEKEEKELAEKEKIEKENKEKEEKEKEEKEAKEKEKADKRKAKKARPATPPTTSESSAASSSDEADNEESVTSEEENGKKAKKEKWVSVKKEKESKESGVDATPATEEKEVEVQATQSVEVSE